MKIRKILPNKVTGVALVSFTLIMIKVEVSGLSLPRLIALIAFALAAATAAPLSFGSNQTSSRTEPK